jgi:hypothetical protein
MTISTSDRLIPLRDVPGLPWLPRRRGSQGRLAVSTVWRWALRGRNGVRLEMVRVGGCLCTTEAALMEFFRTLGPASDSPTSRPPAARTPAQRQRAAERAARELERAGI